jgi:hypothetical protein
VHPHHSMIGSDGMEHTYVRTGDNHQYCSVLHRTALAS